MKKEILLQGDVLALTKCCRLTLGSSLSGKTTVYRQIQSMQGHNFSEGQREEYRATILDNLISASLLLSFRVRDPEIELNAVAQKVCGIVASVSFFDYLILF